MEGRKDLPPDPYIRDTSRIKEPRRFETAATTKSVGPQRRSSFSIGCSAQTIPNNVLTAVTFDVVNFDTDGLHNTSTKITLPSVSRSAAWQFEATIFFNAALLGYRFVGLYKTPIDTGVPVLLRSWRFPVVAGDVMTGSVMKVDLDPRPNDFYEVYVQQTSGGSLGILGGFDGYIAW